MNDLVPRRGTDLIETTTLVTQIRAVANRGLRTIGDTRIVRVMSLVLCTLADYLAAWSDSHRYVRKSRKDFKTILAALEKGDHAARLCASYCKRFHIMSSGHERTLFVEGFLACYQLNSEWAIGVFANCERQDIESFVSHFSR